MSKIDHFMNALKPACDNDGHPISQNKFNELCGLKMIERKEMSLSEWCERLPSIHRVNVELKEIKHQLARRDAEVSELKKLLTLIFESTHPYRDDGTCTFSDSVTDKWKELMP